MTATFRLRPLCLALLLTGIASTANAADLLQAYELARQSDPQLAAADSIRLAQGEAPVQARAALLPQINGSAGFNDNTGDSSSTRPISINPLILSSSTGSNDSRSRNYNINLQQSIFDRRNYTRLNSARARRRKIALGLEQHLLRNQYIHDGPGADLEAGFRRLQRALCRDQCLLARLDAADAGQQRLSRV